jgi:hypothetical protein
MALIFFRRTKECWTNKKTIGGQSLRWNGLIKAYLEVDDDDDDYDYDTRENTCRVKYKTRVNFRYVFSDKVHNRNVFGQPDGLAGWSGIRITHLVAL